MQREQIKEMALANGFKLKTQPDGTEDLNPYVYEFAAALVDTLLPKASPGCFEVPRMCEVFSLPVYSERENIVDQEEYFADCLTEKQAAVIACAINNHDSMRAASLMSARDLVALAEKADQLQAEVERITKLNKTFSKLIHNQVVANQAAWIEWQHGKGAEAAMVWVHNGLWGPGQIPDESEPWATDPQAYYDANNADPFPVCPCGRPSNHLWMGNGACCHEHMKEIQQKEQAKEVQS